MSDLPLYPTPPVSTATIDFPHAQAHIEFARPDWERRLIAKIRELRREGKRCILLFDGTVIFVFRAENAGTIRMAE